MGVAFLLSLGSELSELGELMESELESSEHSVTFPFPFVAFVDSLLEYARLLAFRFYPVGVGSV